MKRVVTELVAKKIMLGTHTGESSPLVYEGKILDAKITRLDEDHIEATILLGRERVEN